MKRRQILTLSAITSIIALLSVSYKGDEKMIETNAYGYLYAMSNYHISEAKNFATTETVNNTLHFVEETIIPNLDPNFVKQNTPATIEINQVTIIDDSTAEVAYTSTTPKEVKEGKLEMVKENQEWKAKVIINIPKFMTIKSDTLSGKEMDAKYKGKLKPVTADSIKPRFSK